MFWHFRPILSSIWIKSVTCGFFCFMQRNMGFKDKWLSRCHLHAVQTDLGDPKECKRRTILVYLLDEAPSLHGRQLLFPRILSAVKKTSSQHAAEWRTFFRRIRYHNDTYALSSHIKKRHKKLDLIQLWHICDYYFRCKGFSEIPFWTCLRKCCQRGIFFSYWITFSMFWEEDLITKTCFLSTPHCFCSLMHRSFAPKRRLV